MSHIKTLVLFIGLTLAASHSLANPVMDCFNSKMASEGIANMQNRYNPNTIAGKAAIKIWNFCSGQVKKTSSNTTIINPEDIQTLECTPETCPPIEQPTEIAI